MGHAHENESMTATASRELRLIGLSGVPLVREGDDLCEIVNNALAHSGEALRNGDILVIAQKVVSKARGRYVDLNTIEPSVQAVDLSKTVEKDPRLIELILRESTEVLRARRDVIVVVHRLGFVMANAGIDCHERQSRPCLAQRNGRCGNRRQWRRNAGRHARQAGPVWPRLSHYPGRRSG
jgi:hypothetical protein